MAWENQIKSQRPRWALKGRVGSRTWRKWRDRGKKRRFGSSTPSGWFCRWWCWTFAVASPKTFHLQREVSARLNQQNLMAVHYDNGLNIIIMSDVIGVCQFYKGMTFHRYGRCNVMWASQQGWLSCICWAGLNSKLAYQGWLSCICKASLKSKPVCFFSLFS